MLTLRSRSVQLNLLWLSLVTLLSAFAAMPASGYAESGGAAVAWGENYHTQLGAGYKSGQPEPRPVSVVGLNTITAIAAGDSFDLALLSNETVDSWGGNTYAELGDGSREDTWEKQTPHVSVSGLSKVKAISASGEHAMALLSSGTVMAWGTNQDGELGDGEGGVKTNKEVPAEVPGLSHVTAIASGGASNFALLENGELMAWGSNTKGQLGIGKAEHPEECETELGKDVCSTKPRAVLLPEAVKKGEVHVVAISAGAEFALALLSNGTVLAWGDNGKGELGTGGSNTDFYEPQTVANLGEGKLFGKSIAISAGNQHALAILENHKVVGWGMNANGALGEKRTEECQKTECYATPHEIAGLENITAIAAGQEYSMVLAGEKIYSFGKNNYDQLGRETTEEVSRVPTAITGEGMEHVTAVATGNLDAIALLKHEVAGPAPLVTLTPETEALKIAWTALSSEYRVCYAAFEKTDTPKCTSSAVAISETKEKRSYEEKSYVFSGLSKTPYAVNFKTNKSESGRWLVATPH
jgi:alpha-tubulin suppressor-like RCC1 family protein